MSLLAAALCGACLSAVAPRAPGADQPPFPAPVVEDLEVVPLTLDEVLARVRARWPAVVAARDRAKASADSEAAGARWPNPSFDLRRENWRPGGGAPNALEPDVFAVLSQPIEIGGQRGARRRLAAAETQVVATDVDREERDLVLAASETFLAAVRARDRLRVLEAQRDGIVEIVTLLRRRVEEGVTAEADLRKVEADLGRAAMDAAREGASLFAALAALGAYLGQDPPPAAASLTLPAPAGSQPRPAIDASLLRRADVRGARAREALAAAAADLEQRRRWPDLVVSAGYKRTAGLDTGVAGLTVPVPVFDRHERSRALARAALRGAELERQQVERLARAEIAAAIARADTLAALAGRVADDLVGPAEVARRAARSSFREGAGDILRWLDAERVHADAAREAVDVRVGPVATAFGEIYQYLVEGETADPMTAKTLHDWDVRNRLRAVPGVSEVNSWGGLTQQYHVIVDPTRLEKYGLSLGEVVSALSRNNASFSGGFIEHRSERVTVRGVGLASGVADLASVVLTSVDGVPITAGDVARVAVGAMPRQGAVTRDGRGESIAGMVIMLKGENGREVAGRVKAQVEAIQKSLPAGLRLTPFYDQTEVIDRTAHTVRKNLVEGSLLVVGVLLLFLRDLRAALIVAAVIPVSMLAGFVGMRVFGVSANLMSLGAIDFGLIVDGAVVMMENFVRRRGEAAPALAGAPPGVVEDARRRLFTSAATEVARPILFGVLIIIAVYLPIFTLEGLEGKMFRPMAITVCSALVGALVLSLTAVPVVSSYLLPLSAAHHDGPWFSRLRARYVTHLEDAMNHRGRTLAVAIAVVAVAVASVPLLGTEFMPRLDEGAILIETRKLPSVSLAESVAISTRVEQIVGRFPEVKQVVTKLGRPDLATEAMGIYQGDVYVLLHPPEQWTTGRDKAALIAAIDEALAAVPGVEVNFTQPMAMRLDEVVSGVKADVAVKVFGPDAAVLERVGEAVGARLEGVAGVADLQVEVLSGASQIEIDIDRAAAARYALNVSDVQELVETAIGGTQATEVLDGARRFGVVVRLPDDLHADLDAIARLTLTAPAGERVPVSRIARVRQTTTPEAITHENGERRLVVQANVRGRDVGSFVADARARLADLTVPAGYYITWGGQFENQQRAMRRLLVVVPLSLAIIFLLLFATFGLVRQALLVILNVPFALVGGVAALWIRGLTLNLSASVGFIALFGVAVLNGVVMIAAVNALRGEGRALRAAVLEGAGTRLKPVLMTALVAAFGFVPMAVSHGAGAEVQRPLATVVIGGVVTATLLTLIVVPTVYEMMEARVARRRG